MEDAAELGPGLQVAGWDPDPLWGCSEPWISPGEPTAALFHLCMRKKGHCDVPTPLTLGYLKSLSRVSTPSRPPRLIDDRSRVVWGGTQVLT